MSTYSGASVLSVAQSTPTERALFIRRTYGHLAGAVAAFVVIEALLLKAGLGVAMLQFMAGGQSGWLLFLGAFMLLGWLARGLATSTASSEMQYAGLAIYVVAQAIIFAPMITIATVFGGPDVISSAAVLTGLLFAGLTAIVFQSQKDFSFMGGILSMGGFLALGLIICGALFGFNLGLWFSVAMVGLASAGILYDTSNIVHHYRPDQHVAASLELFASVALLFWYILRIVMSLSSRD